MKYWEALQPGDIVDVIVPAAKPRPRTLGGIRSFLKSWGLKTRLPSGAVGRDLLFANSAEKRFEFLKAAVLSEDSKMIWCVRGGYGSLHLLDQLHRLSPPPPKCFLGYSDITTLHTHLIQKWGWATLHGPNIDRFALGKGTKTEAKRIKDLVFGKSTQVSFRLRPLNQVKVKNQLIRSRVVGGNLTTLQASFGTQDSIQLKNRLLFIEDIGERAYRVDRILEQMRQLGLFKGVDAVVIGQFTYGREPNGRSLLPQFFKQWAEQQSFPVLIGLPSGHGLNQQPLPLGTRAILDLKSRRLSVETGARIS
jgi:muramoyltetrapeptide carboxypeptidase